MITLFIFLTADPPSQLSPVSDTLRPDIGVSEMLVDFP